MKLKEDKEKVLNSIGGGTQMDKTVRIEAKLAPLLKQIDDATTAMKYWRGISKLIENKISLGQSILANITSQVKAGLYLENVK